MRAEIVDSASSSGIGRRTTPYALADKVVVKIDDRDARVADLKAGTVIQVKLSDDWKEILEIAAGAKIKLAEQKPEGKEAPAPKQPKRPVGKNGP